jgi:hypothetical protein
MVFGAYFANKAVAGGGSSSAIGFFLNQANQQPITPTLYDLQLANANNNPE